MDIVYHERTVSDVEEGMDLAGDGDGAPVLGPAER
jgi:hypothetical protein